MKGGNSSGKKPDTDIGQLAVRYCNEMADTLEETMEKYEYPEYEQLWRIFIGDVRQGKYFLHFNFRLVDGDISIQPRTNVGLAITEYTDRLLEKQKGHNV